MTLKIVIEDLVYQKIMYWVDKAGNFEISGLGNVIVEDGNIIVTDAILLTQENTSVETDISGEDISRAMYHLKDCPGELKWWWHSHVDMDVFWSGTDLATIEELSSQAWFAATVFNQKREYRSAFSQIAPVKMLVDDIETVIKRNIDRNLVDLWEKEFDEKVTVKTISVITSARDYSSYDVDSGVHRGEWWKEYGRKPEDLSEEEMDDIIAEAGKMEAGTSWSEEYDEIQKALRNGS